MQLLRILPLANTSVQGVVHGSGSQRSFFAVAHAVALVGPGVLRRIDRCFQIGAGAAHDAPQQWIEAFAVVRQQSGLELNSSNRGRKFVEALRVELPAGVAGIEVATDAVESRVFKAGRQRVADVLPAIADIVRWNNRISGGSSR